MNRKLFSIIFMVTGTFFVFLIYSIHAMHPVEGTTKTEGKKEDRIAIAHKEIFGVLERPQVIFDHAKHTDALKEEDCEACHPANKDGRLNFEFILFPTGHAEEKGGPGVFKTLVMDLYHEKCINCHNKKIAEKKKAGPVICGECHLKGLESLSIKYDVMEFDFHYHKKHVDKFKKDCDNCHHIYDEEDEELVCEEGTEQSCYYCHDNQDKRGLSLTAQVRATAKKGLTIRKASHQLCLNCHIDYRKKNLKAGHTECSKCHTGKYRTVAELLKVIRPDVDQPAKPLITIEKARMKEVLFDHKFHETNTKTCRACHHETLKACKQCHGLISKPEGKGINISGAYHDALSRQSCGGCHRIKKSEKICAGCHSHIPEMSIRTNTPKKETCRKCHNGRKAGLSPAQRISVSQLYSEKLPKEVKIKAIEKDYEPAVFPHMKVLKKLVEISNESKMATYFHRNLQTICEGCHHNRHLEAEAKKNNPPFCRSCHTISFDNQNINRPRLLAAYHRRCIECHEKMEIKAMQCKDCHKEKKEQTGG